MAKGMLMRKSPLWISMAVMILLSACVDTGSNRASNTDRPANPYAGSYKGSEALEGGTFPIWIIIDAAGKIRITDVDNITGSGEMDGDRFITKRPVPYQVFEGTVSGTKITGKTHGNSAFGAGTFFATRE